MSKRLSVVIPAFNESGNVPELVRLLTATLDGLGRDEGWAPDAWELIFVDDGSRDRPIRGWAASGCRVNSATTWPSPPDSIARAETPWW